MRLILLIEDKINIRESTIEILQFAGYRVLTAENGEDGIEITRECRPDLILCDISLPLLDGFGVLVNLTKDVRTAGIPFIFLSAKTIY